METAEIKKALIDIFIDHGFKEKDIVSDKTADNVLRFSHKKVNYIIYIEGPEDITYAIESIDDAGYDSDFLQNRDECGDIDHFDGYLHGIQNGDFQDLRRIWLDLEKIEEKYSESGFEIEEIIAFKYGMR